MSVKLHKISSDKKPNHIRPQGPNPWCKWARAKAEGSLAQFKHPEPLDANVQKVLFSIYKELSSDELLNRCVGRFTQNNNESL